MWMTFDRRDLVLGDRPWVFLRLYPLVRTLLRFLRVVALVRTVLDSLRRQSRYSLDLVLWRIRGLIRIDFDINQSERNIACSKLVQRKLK